MQPVEIMPIQDSLILRARGSELLILAQHISELKQRKSKRDFSMYFTGEALVNRPARKLFEAWLRKDGTLWERLFQMVHEMEQGAESDEKPVVKANNPALTAKSKVVEAAAAEPTPKVAKTAEKQPEKTAKSKATVAKSESGKTAKSAPAKSTAKAAAKDGAGGTSRSAAVKKSAATKPAKAIAKTAAKAGSSKSKPAAKTAAKSAGKSAAKKR